MADGIGVEIRGTNRVRNQLRIIASFHPDRTDPIIGKHAKAEQRTLRATPYPPKRPGQTYVRKRFFGGIAGSFSARKVKTGVWDVRNSRLYATYVIGKRQAWMHKGRWWIMADEMQKRMPNLTNALSVELEMLLDRA